jgi:cellulose synthase/poly-beta-1,6-N-acetylglucosamine synthase-like glycosyltransferase
MYNAQNTIQELLDALNAQTYTADFEVILVDDGSGDNTLNLVKNRIQQHNVKYTINLVENHHSGPAYARNTGVHHANGEIIVFTDSDCVPNQDWLMEMVNKFEDPSIGGVGGTYETKNPHSIVARYIGHDIGYRHSKYSTEIDFAGTYSAAFRKDLFLKAGLFSSEYKEANAEDNELSYRIIDQGAKIVFAKNAIVRHPHPETVSKMFKQQLSRATWRVMLFRRNKSHSADNYTGKWTIIQPFLWALIPLYFFFLLIDKLFLNSGNMIITFLFSYYGFLLLIALLFVIYGILNINLIRWIRQQRNESFSAIISIYFLIILRSIAWFLGGIKGFWQFIIKKK